MIWFIIGLVAFIVVTIRLCCDEWYDLGEKFVGIFLAFIITALSSLGVLIITSAIVSSVAEVEYNIFSDTKIVALKDNQNVNGSFYIMGGYVNEDLYYYYATETEFGYKTEKIKADNAYIKYTDSETHIEKYKPEFTKSYVYLFAFPMNLSRYIIYCPDGTVTNEFRVDLE